MRILHICSYYINDKFYSSFFDSLKKVGIENSAYVFANTSKKNNRIVLKYAKVSYCFNSFDRIFFHLKHYKVFRDMKANVNFKEYDIIHAHSLFSNGYIAYLIKKRYGIPYVITVRYPDFFTFFKWMPYLRPLGKKILDDAEKIIFLSESSKDATFKYINGSLLRKVISKTLIIPNGIDDYWINNILKDKKNISDKNNIKLIFVGRINKNKNPEILIKICSILKTRGIEPKLYIVGKIEDKRYINIFNKYEFIIYCGECEKERLIEYYRTADIFIMLSHKETFGLVYAEAMSQGLPIIYSKGQGFDKQFADGEVGYPCSYNNANEACEAIINIMSNYEKLSENCLKNVRRYSWNKITENIVKNAYEKVLI